MSHNAEGMDSQRTGFGQQYMPSQEALPAGFEEILEVQIPVNLIKPDPPSDILYYPQGRDASARIIPKVEFSGEIDPRLDDALNTVFPIAGPELRFAGRMLVNTEKPFSKELDDNEDEIGRIDIDALRQRLQIHERNMECRGSHGYTLLNPKTNTATAHANSFALHEFIRGESDGMHTSRVYNELFAIAAEAAYANSAVRPYDSDSPSPLDQLLLKNRDADPAYDMAYRILEFFHADTYCNLNYETILDLLDIGRRSPAPDKWLCHTIKNLLNRDSPLEAATKGYYWEEVMERPYDEWLKSVESTKDQNITNHSTRVLSTTFETVTIDARRNRVVRRWWSYDPPEPFPLAGVRYPIHFRDIFDKFTELYGQPPVIDPTSPVTADGTTILGYNFQQNGNPNPFYGALTGELSHDEISHLFNYKINNNEYNRMKNIAGRQTLSLRGFDDSEQLTDWVNAGLDIYNE